MKTIRNKKALAKIFEPMTEFEILTYCNENFELLGTGSSRIVFALNDKWVLKIPLNGAGVEQNNHEINVYSELYCFSNKVKSLFTKIHYEYSSPYFVFAERAEKIHHNNKLVKNFISWLKPSNYYLYAMFGNLYKLVDKEKNSVKKQVYQLEANTQGNTITDLSARNLGVVNGKIKIIDYGFNNHLNKMYLSNRINDISYHDKEKYFKKFSKSY